MMPARKGLLHKALQACTFIMLVLPYASAMAAEEPELERLFNTPQRRAQLDELRRRNVPIQRPATTPVTQNIRLDGIVRRTSGPTTVWINGEPRATVTSTEVADASALRVSTGSDLLKSLSRRRTADPELRADRIGQMRHGANGYVLLALLLVLISVAGAITVFSHRDDIASGTGNSLDRNGTSRKALAEAKSALIAYATANQNSPGDLPCPSPTSNNAEGAITIKGEITNCTVTAGAPPREAIGRFPWKSLGVGPRSMVTGNAYGMSYIILCDPRSKALSAAQALTNLHSTPTRSPPRD
ncbi:MAG: hypothetical protein IPN40_03625 [Uliginosibacterium sp.]|nr:hypothetical protein [Uliginosibacterium sp.]